jgi:hypothetical protein
MNPTKTKDVINFLFEAKPIEKRNEWISFLESEEFESVDDLKSISEDGTFYWS